MNNIKKGNYQVHFVCSCGHYSMPSFGRRFFIRETCCPKCGSDPIEWKRKIRRWIPKQKVIIEGYWENK